MCILTRRSQVMHQNHEQMEFQPLISSYILYFYYSVFFLTGDLENRAVIRESATLLIMNATRSDTARYRCEVTAADDQKSFDEILIDLVVRGNLVYFEYGLICMLS